MVKLRAAELRDSKAIRALVWRVGINPFALDWQRFIVAVDKNNRVIGCGQIKPHGNGIRELASIAVQPEHQNQGIGQRIIRELLAHSPGTLFLTCRASLGPYYRRFGFQHVQPGQMPPYYRRIARFVSIIRRLFPRSEELWVMRRDA